MKRLLGRRARLTALIVTVGVAAGGVAYASIPDGGGVIHGCYKKKAGTLRVIDSTAGGLCKSSEVSLAWSQTGPQGPPGADGAQGPQGPQGPAGAIAARAASAATGASLGSFISGDLLTSLTLPAGNWAIWAHVGLSPDAGNTTEYTATCRIVAGADIDALSVLESLSTQGLKTGSEVLPLMGLASLPSGGTTELRCHDSLSQPAAWSNAKILAVQVTTIG